MTRSARRPVGADTSSHRELGRSWLVQRLNRPQTPHPLLGADNPFAFGGGLVNGGLSKDAMQLLRPIFSFDYMGAAEFESGDATLYALAAEGLEQSVTSRVQEWASGEERLKEMTRLPAALRPVEEWDDRTIGWLELDNGFFVFTDETAWSMTCDLFGVTR